MQGKYVKLELNSSNASSATAVNMYDDQFNAVSLQDHEQLRVLTLNLMVLDQISVQVFADENDDDAVDDGERVAVGDQGTHTVSFEHETMGLACPNGVGLSVLASGAGDFLLVGVGRIINNEPENPGGKPSWVA